MTALLASPPTQEKEISSFGQRFLLHVTTWAKYRAVADLFEEIHVRLTYDRGRLEFMTLSNLHEWLSKLIGRLIEKLTEEMNLPIRSAGSTTLNREDLDRGVEPDQCYYLENEPLMRHRDQIDLTRDPPPDLAIEVEVTRSALNRMSIYAALGIPEVWRFDGATLHVHQRTPDGTYTAVERSPHFPFLPLAEIVKCIGRRHEISETELVRSFRAWVRAQIAGNWENQGRS